MPILTLSNQFCQLNNIPNETEFEVKVIHEKPIELVKVVIDPYDEQDYEILVSHRFPKQF